MNTLTVRYILAFFSGILLMLSIAFYSEWSYEDDVLDIMAKHIYAANPKKDIMSLTDSAVATAYYVIHPMVKVFGTENFNTPKTYFTSPSFMAYYYGSGACGGYSIFMARLFKKMGFRVRFVEQKAYNKWGAHITLGIESGTKLLLVDPLNHCVFKDSTGKMSDINDVSRNWKYYKMHVPPKYDTNYNYQAGWRYTNWNKFGFLSRSVYKLCTWIYGEKKTNELSLRVYFLGQSKMRFIVSFCAFCIVFTTLVGMLFKKP